MKYLVSTGIGLGALIPTVAQAHCPLCTAAAGGLAILAASLGISSVVVGLLIGAFSYALSVWLSTKIKKQYIPYQQPLLSLIIFFGTVIPIMPLVQEYAPLYISISGAYGTPLHTTYTINLYIVGVIIGVLVMAITPWISRGITRIRGSQMPFQGLSIAIGLLIIIALIIQLLV